MTTPSRYWSCERKRAYSRHAAKQAKKRALDKRGAKLWIYTCPFCGQLHLTHKPAQKQIKKEA